MNRRIFWPLCAGISVAATAAVVASATTLAALASGAGWMGWTPWLLPAALDVGTSCGGLCWLGPGAPDRARSFAKKLTIVGLLAGLAGNAAGHLLESSFLASGPFLIIVVGAVPAAMLGALVHLAALLVEPHSTGELTVDPLKTTDQPAQPGPAQDTATAKAGLLPPETPSAVAAANRDDNPAGTRSDLRHPVGGGIRPEVVAVGRILEAVAEVADRHSRTGQQLTANGNPTSGSATEVAEMAEVDQINWFAHQIANGGDRSAKDWAAATGMAVRTVERRLAVARKTLTTSSERRSENRQESTA